ncbi:unnamed protein product [Mytilus coruscus]|uniref:Uncharacterized protein n=1 Tax=Mytilus coruscus TaxID=42192 RepID=A0A6J8BSB0_MYTCO|nr:unnamed protein product [Mytilus coruscus]
MTQCKTEGSVSGDNAFVDVIEVHEDSSEFGVDDHEETMDELLESLNQISGEYDNQTMVKQEPEEDDRPDVKLHVFPSNVKQEFEPSQSPSSINSTCTVTKEVQVDESNDEDVTETVSITLVTTRRYVGDELFSERREQIFSSSLHHDPRDVDCESFFEGVQGEIAAHAQDQHRRQAEAENSE